MPQPSKVIIAIPPVIALAGWLVPGSGYFLLGQRARGAAVGITIISLFIMGLLIGGMKVVDAPDNFLTDPLVAVMQKPWFIGQILIGPLGPIASAIGKAPAYLLSHSRINEIGTLYTAVAGMLNLLAIIDSAYRASHAGKENA